MKQIPKIAGVKALPGKHLEVIFENGVRKDYDCNPVSKRPKFFMLKDEGFFRSVKVDTGGYGISWNDDVDVSEYEAWENGTVIDK
jgi:hypothetical protein